MRILFWTEAFWPAIGGIEVLASNLLPALRARGHQILVVTDDDLGRLPARDDLRSIPIRRLGMRAALRARSLDEITAVKGEVLTLQRTFRPDILHINGLGPTAFFLRSPAPPPLLVTLHTEWLPRSKQPTLLAKVLSEATWTTAVCHSVLASAARSVPEIVERSSIVYNAVAEPEEPLQPLPFDPPRLMCVGRLEPEKGFDLAIDAFARIATRGNRLRLILCGEGSERAALEQRATGLGIRDRVEITGWINPALVAEILNTATVVLMPSRSEALPLAGIEAALMARPIVATRVGGLPELVEDGVTGVLTDPVPEALAAAVTALLDDPKRTVRMGLAGRERACRLFDWERCVDSYQHIYEKLVEEMRHG